MWWVGVGVRASEAYTVLTSLLCPKHNIPTFLSNSFQHHFPQYTQLLSIRKPVMTSLGSTRVWFWQTTFEMGRVTNMACALHFESALDRRASVFVYHCWQIHKASAFTFYIQTSSIHPPQSHSNRNFNYGPMKSCRTPFVLWKKLMGKS